MTQQLEPQINVSITPALRALLASRTFGAIDAVAPKKSKRRVADKEVSATPALRPLSQKHRLRRDGQRPLQIEGFLIASETVPVPMNGVVLEQRMEIYADASDDTYMTLALLVPPDVPARSLFAAGWVSASTPTNLVLEWSDKATAIMARLASPLSHPDSRLHVDNAFRSLTSLCLRPEHSLNERIRT